jgi:DNA-binding winged helix-turn-helix (wHTH) protein/TolB-like protein
MTYTFGTFAFDDATLELTREGRRVSLEPQPARALARLLAGAGALVTRDEMREAIWGAHTHVDYDRGLAYCIGQVRTALVDSGDNPRFVQTLPKRGFRFVAPVSATAAATAAEIAPATTEFRADLSVAAADPTRPDRRWALGVLAAGLVLAGGWWLWPARATDGATVAVSIFDNETGDPANDAFVLGLADVVVSRLTSLAPGRVGIIGNAAPLRQPRNIRNLAALSASLDADYLVLGQLQRQDDDLRFIVHFIRLRDGVHLSAQRFVRPPGELQQFEADVVGEAERAVRTVAGVASEP